MRKIIYSVSGYGQPGCSSPLLSAGVSKSFYPPKCLHTHKSYRYIICFIVVNRMERIYF